MSNTRVYGPLYNGGTSACIRARFAADFFPLNTLSDGMRTPFRSLLFVARQNGFSLVLHKIERDATVKISRFEVFLALPRPIVCALSFVDRFHSYLTKRQKRFDRSKKNKKHADAIKISGYRYFHYGEILAATMKIKQVIRFVN